MACKTPVHSCTHCQTRQTSEWRTLNAEELESVDNAKQTRAYQPGDILYHQGQGPEGVYCIQSGLVGLRRIDEDGNSALLRLCNPGETVGYRAVLSGEDHRNMAEIMTPSVVCFIRRAVVMRLVADNPHLGERFFQHCLDDMSKTEDDYARRLTLKMKARFLHMLMVLYQQSGYRDEEEMYVLELPIQRTALAELIGTTPESISRMIGKLETQGLAQFEDRRVRIPDIEQIFREIGMTH